MQTSTMRNLETNLAERREVRFKRSKILEERNGYLGVRLTAHPQMMSSCAHYCSICNRKPVHCCRLALIHDKRDTQCWVTHVQTLTVQGENMADTRVTVMDRYMCRHVQCRSIADTVHR